MRCVVSLPVFEAGVVAEAEAQAAVATVAARTAAPARYAMIFVSMTSSTSVMRIDEGLGVAGAELSGAEEDEDYGVSCEDGELTQAENMCGGRRPLVAVV